MVRASIELLTRAMGLGRRMRHRSPRMTLVGCRIPTDRPARPSLRRTATTVLAAVTIVTALTLDVQRGWGQKPRAYSAFEFGSLDPGAVDVVRRLSASGEIVGGGHGSGRGHQAFVLRRSGREDLTFQHRRDESAAFDINDAGGTVGEFNGDVALRPFRKGRGGRVEPLATLPGDPAGSATGINRHGEAVGYSSGPHGIRAVWWTRAGAIRALSGLPGAEETRAVAINDGRRYRWRVGVDRRPARGAVAEKGKGGGPRDATG